MDYGLWFMVSAVGGMLYGLWFMVSAVGGMLYGLWFMVSAVGGMLHGLWLVLWEVCFMVYFTDKRIFPCFVCRRISYRHLGM